MRKKVVDGTKDKGHAPPRHQGRPTGDKEVGRSRIIEKMREVMKSRPRVDIQRREIADFMGVTPALVGYYFPDKRSLIEEAAGPVIDDYISKVRDIIVSGGDARDTLKLLIYAFIQFNSESGYLLDFYIDQVTTRKDHNSLPKLHEIYDQMNGFFSRLITIGLIRGQDPRLVQSALWGMCRYIGQQQSATSFSTPGSDEKAVLAHLAHSIFDIVANGLFVTKPNDHASPQMA